MPAYLIIGFIKPFAFHLCDPPFAAANLNRGTHFFAAIQIFCSDSEMKY